MSTRHIATSTLWQIASQAAMAVLSIVTAKFVAVGLSKELTGYYNSAYGYLQIFAILADFGLYAVSVRELSKANDKETMLGSLLVLRGLATVIALGAAVFFAFLVPSWQGTPFPTGVAIASLVPFFTLLAGMMRTVFQIHYKMQFIFVAEVLQRIFTTLGIGVFIFVGMRLSEDVRVYQAFLWIGSIGAVVLFAISFFYAQTLMRIRPHLDRRLLKHILLLAMPFGLTYLCITLYRQMDVVFISLLRPDFALQNAYYGFAGRVEDMAFLIPTLLLNSVLPVLSKRLADREDVRSLLGKTLFALLILGSVFTLFSFLWARPLTLIFATKAYLSTPTQPGTDRALELMAVPMFLNGIILYCFYVSLASHAWKKLMGSFAIGVACSIILNLLWTARYGFVGAASALIVVHALLAAILLPMSLRHTPVDLPLRSIVRWLVFSIILGALLFVSAPWMTSAKEVLAGCLIAIPIMGLLVYSMGIQRGIQVR